MKKNASAMIAILVLTSSSICCRHETGDSGVAQAFRGRLQAEIQASGAEVGYAFKDLQTGRSVLVNERTVMHAASTMKVAVMIEVFKQAREGRFGLDDPLAVKNEFLSLADGSSYSLNPADDADETVYDFVGQSLPIRQLINKMITVSSNLATDILIDLVKPSSIGATLEGMGITGIKVLRGVEDAKAYEKGLNNTTDAFGLLQALESIAAGEAGSQTDCREMIEILSQQTFREGIPAGLPSGIKVANKTGQIDRLDHDAAIIFPQPEGRKPYVLVVLTRGLEDHKAAARLIAGLSRLTYDFVTGK